MKMKFGFLILVSVNADSTDDDRLITNKNDWQNNFIEVSLSLCSKSVFNINFSLHGGIKFLLKKD